MLITGANGVVGSDLVKFFSKNNKVYALYRSSNKINKKLKNKNIVWIKHDLSKKIFIKIKPKIIIHCAVIHSLSKKKKISDFINTNILGLLNLIDFAKKNKIKKIIHLSSVNIYGEIKSKILKETNFFNKPDLLGSTKILMEKLISLQDINYLNIRLPGVVGYQINDTRRPWLCKIVNQLKLNKKVEIFNSNKKFNNIIDTYEIYKFINLIKEKKYFKNGNINFSSTKPLVLKDIIFFLQKKLNSKSKLFFKKQKKTHFIISSNKVLENYNFKISSTKKVISRYINSFLKIKI